MSALSWPLDPLGLSRTHVKTSALQNVFKRVDCGEHSAHRMGSPMCGLSQAKNQVWWFLFLAFSLLAERRQFFQPVLLLRTENRLAHLFFSVKHLARQFCIHLNMFFKTVVCSFKCPNFTRMHSHPGKDSTNFLTFRFNLDGAAHPALQWEFVSLSHRLDFPRHSNDGTQRKNVTDGRS